MNDYLISFSFVSTNQSFNQSVNLPLQRDEIFLSHQPNCTFTYGDVDSNTRVSINLTSHRLIIDLKNFIHLSLIDSFTVKSGLFQSYTIKLNVIPYPTKPANQSNNHPTEDGGLVDYEKLLINPSVSRNKPLQPGYFKLVFHSNCDPEMFRSKLQIALDSKAWTRTFATLENEVKQLAIKMSLNNSNPAHNIVPSTTGRAFSTNSAGVSGLIRSAQSESQNVDATLKAAFSDLDALMKSAADLIALAEKFSKSRAKSDSLTESAEEREVASLMQSFGLSHIVNPVERSNAGSNQSYYVELAREIMTLLQPRFNNSSTEMLTLTDVYCLYNRARGVSLISPSDCLKACQQLGRVSAQTSNDPLILHEFVDSRARVVCRSSLVDSSSVNEKLIQAINQSLTQSLSVLEASSRLNLSSLLVEQRCAQLEREGRLVRDESMEGCKFMINRFPEFHLTILKVVNR